MKKGKHSIKFRITFWYTLIFSMILSMVFLTIYQLSQNYSIHDLESELIDETADMVENLEEEGTFYLEHADWTAFYDDNVMVSLYRQDGTFVNGVSPENFPEGIPFEEERSRKITSEQNIWLMYDYQYVLDSGEILWIRSIASYTYWTRILKKILWIFAFLFPLVVSFTTAIGYQILKKALFPIYSISDTAKDISNSVNLSKRIESSDIKDEFSYLIEAFNSMLATLEESFEKEKQFTSDVAHELRTPIAVIQSHCEYCLEDLALSEEVKEEIEIIYNKTKHISALVSQLLTIARTDKRSFQPENEEVNLVFLIETILEELEEKALKKKITLSFEKKLKEEDEIIHGDMMLLMRMIYNLVENAIAYGKEQGHVWIHLSKGYLTEDSVLDLEKDKKMILTIKDDGIGIEQEHLGKIWNRFYRVDKSRTGGESFGLGLSMVRFIVGIHQGSIDVKSTPGEGSIFTVIL